MLLQQHPFFVCLLLITFGFKAYHSSGYDYNLTAQLFTDGMILDGSLTYDEKKSDSWQFVCSGSNDGVTWDELGNVSCRYFPAGTQQPLILHL